MKYIAPVAELVSMETVNVLLASVEETNGTTTGARLPDSEDE